MKRDLDTFPNDENGDALYKMAMEGDNLASPREIDFFVLFPTEQQALSFGETLLFNRQKVSLADNHENPHYPFEIRVHVHMEPTHDKIDDYEKLLEEYAQEQEGFVEGWGCYSQE